MSFRERSGLRADSEYVQRAAKEDAAFPNRDWGIPLTNAEAEEVERRAARQDAADAVSEHFAMSPDYAGAFFDDTAGIPAFSFTGNAEIHRAEIAALLPPGAAFRLESVPFTRTQLDAAQDEVDAAWPRLVEAGVHIEMTSIDPSINRVVITVDGLTPTQEVTLRSRFGPIIHVEDG